MKQTDGPRAAGSADVSARDEADKIVALAENVFYERIPFNLELGLRPRSTSLAEVVTEFGMRPGLVGNFEHDILHGGVIAAVIDSTAGMMAFIGALAGVDLSEPEVLRQRFARMGTIDMRIDYLRPARGALFAITARELRHGRRVSVVRADLENEAGELLATGTCTYIVS